MLDLKNKTATSPMPATFTREMKNISKKLRNQKRKFQYEEEIKANSINYDAWFDFIRLMEAESSQEAVQEVYERAIANIPPSQEKRFWRRYIYLWIYYALYEELGTGDVDRTRQVYRACLDIIPHKKFTFAKVWLMYAHFEVLKKTS